MINGAVRDLLLAASAAPDVLTAWGELVALQLGAPPADDQEY